MLSAIRIHFGQQENPVQENPVQGNQASRLITANMNPHQRARIAEMVNANFPEQRTTFVDQALRLITADMNVAQQIRIAEIVTAILPEQRTAYVDQVLRISTLHMRGFQRVEIARAVAEIPSKRRISCVDQASLQITAQIDKRALRKITKGMNIYQQLCIEEIVARIPPEDRKACVDQVLRLITSDMKGNQRVQIARAIVAMPPEQRIAFVDQALRLITVRMNDIQRARIIEWLDAIPLEEKTAFVNQALRLINAVGADMNLTSQILAIKWLFEKTPEQRIAFVDHVLHQIITAHTENERITILAYAYNIQWLDATPLEERTVFVYQALRLINAVEADMTIVDRIELAKLLVRMTPEERIDFVNQVLRLITAHMNKIERYMIFNYVYNIPLEVRGNHVNRIVQLMSRIYARVQEPVIFDARLILVFLQLADERFVANHGVNVHRREKAVRQALELLGQAQGTLSPLTIDGAVRDCIAYLEGLEQNGNQRGQKALRALQGAQEADETWGSLFSEKVFIIHGLETSGQEVVGRLWLYIQTLEEAERSLARDSLVTALNRGFADDGDFICNPGKVGHLVSAILQGRFDGIEIDELEAQLTPNQASAAFLTPERLQTNPSAIELISQALDFITSDELPNYDCVAFSSLVMDYLDTLEN